MPPSLGLVIQDYPIHMWPISKPPAESGESRKNMTNREEESKGEKDIRHSRKIRKRDFINLLRSTQSLVISLTYFRALEI